MRTRIGIAVLWALALFAPLAHLADATKLKAVAAATQASPAMKVFTAHDGYETFSPRFYVEWRQADGSRQLALTPSVYSRIAGPYNRRNAYGAALSYAPVLSTNPATRALHADVMQYALCDPAPVLDELGIDRESIEGSIIMRIEPRRPLDPKWPLTFEVSCDD